MMRAPATANQRRRSTRNRRAPVAANQNTAYAFRPKLKYENSYRVGTTVGLFVVSSRKRRAPTAEQIEAKRLKQVSIKTKQVSLVALRHEVVSLWNHGMHTENLQFGPKNARKIAEFLQTKHPEKYAKIETARTFVYRALKRFKTAAEQPHLEPHRDRRGENRRSTKRKDPRTVTLVDELLSEPKASGPKVRRQLISLHGITISVATIHRIAKDLSFMWTKPWHTDILTPAQKLKRKLFCAQLLRLPEEALWRRISGWLFSDEKWWDIVGPSASKWIKANSKVEAKMENQVFAFFYLYFFIYAFLFTIMFLLFAG